MSAVSVQKVEQPASFAYTPENEAKVAGIIARYPKGREQSAVMPLLWMAQKQNQNWLPQAAMEMVAKRCNMPVMRVHEVASFYTMFNLAPIGKHFIQCCTTTPCWLAGSDNVVKACRDTLGIEMGETTRDGMFTLREVECLGACANAPMVQIDSHDASELFYEDLTYDSTRELLLTLKRGEKPNVGSQTGRKGSEPLGGGITLTEDPVSLHASAPKAKAPDKEIAAAKEIAPPPVKEEKKEAKPAKAENPAKEEKPKAEKKPAKEKAPKK
jgi:NADH dehydrogenase (ubiquinone) flavoprotein 2